MLEHTVISSQWEDNYLHKNLIAILSESVIESPRWINVDE